MWPFQPCSLPVSPCYFICKIWSSNWRNVNGLSKKGNVVIVNCRMWAHVMCPLVAWRCCVNRSSRELVFKIDWVLWWSRGDPLRRGSKEMAVNGEPIEGKWASWSREIVAEGPSQSKGEGEVIALRVEIWSNVSRVDWSNGRGSHPGLSWSSWSRIFILLRRGYLLTDLK